MRLITLDPGHFHASLVQKSMYDGIDPLVHVYAPAGDDISEHLKRIDAFNKRAAQPTRWREQVYTGPDFFERMLAEKSGNVVVISGNNARKADYVLRSVQAGLNVLADKPMVIAAADFDSLKASFAAAESRHVLLYDIMTERFEISSALQRELAQHPALFGELVQGTPARPAIEMASVHYFSKMVAGVPLQRPQWFFDVRQQGEAIVDVATHLVDLVQWLAFPDQALHPEDATVLNARRGSTPISREQFRKLTGAQQFPAFLTSDVRDGALQVFANGEFTYRLRGVHAKVSATWDFEAPPGSGDTHFALMRGTRANLVIRQGRAQQYQPTLYIEQSGGAAVSESVINAAVASLQEKYPGVGARLEGTAWVVTVPQKYDTGHEAHFAQVTENFLRYLQAGQLPAWEVPGMLTKYSTVMQAYQLSRPRWQHEDQAIAWLKDGQPQWRFSFDPAKGKPFFNPLAAASASLTTFQPEDHPWHYGLWFSWKYLNGANYWEEDRQSGHAEGATGWSVPQIDARPDGSATIRMNVTYTHPSGRVDMTEVRELKISAPTATGLYTIDWVSKFKAGKEGALLDRTPMPGEPEGKINGGYAGLGVRLASAPALMSVVTPEGPVTQFPNDRARPASSAVAANFTTGGHDMGAIAILSDPSNIGERAPWYIVNAAEGMRFMCAAVLAPEVRRIPPAGEWRLSYRIVLQPKAFTAKALAGAVSEWKRMAYSRG